MRKEWRGVRWPKSHIKEWRLQVGSTISQAKWVQRGVIAVINIDQQSKQSVKLPVIGKPLLALTRTVYRGLKLPAADCVCVRVCVCVCVCVHACVCACLID